MALHVVVVALGLLATPALAAADPCQAAFADLSQYMHDQATLAG